MQDFQRWPTKEYDSLQKETHPPDYFERTGAD